MAKFQMNITLEQDATRLTARVADGTGVSNQLTDADRFKLVKMKGDSQYGLCAKGDAIEATLQTHGSPVGTYDGFTLGSILKGGRRRVTFGVVLDIGDFVVAGDVTARGTALPGYPIVDKEGGTPGAFRWRVVSRDGTTAAGQTGVIECTTGAGTGTNTA